MEESRGPASGSSQRWSPGRILRIALLPAVVGALVGIGAIDRLIPQDPYVRVAEEAGAEMLALPGFEDRFGSLDADEAFRAGTQLGAAAISRLPGPQLDEWMTITRQLIGAVDVEQCAMIVRGPGNADEALDVLRLLDIETYRRYFEIVMVGIQLELAGAAEPQPPSQQEADAAIGQLTTAIGMARFQEIGTVMTDAQGASDAAVCSAAQDMYDGLAKLDTQSRIILLRLVVPDPSA